MPDAEQLLSSTGCKRVSEKVDYVMVDTDLQTKFHKNQEFRKRQRDEIQMNRNNVQMNRNIIEVCNINLQKRNMLIKSFLHPHFVTGAWNLTLSRQIFRLVADVIHV